MAGTLNYVDIDNLKAFWGKAKEYINTKVSTDIANIKGTGITVGGSGDYRNSTVEAAITALDGRVDSVESRVAAAETYVQDVNVNNTSTASTKYVTISCTDDNDATSKGKQSLITINDKAVADKFAEIDAKPVVTSVVTTDGNYVKLTPNEAKSGAVNITVDDSAIGTIAGDVSAIKNYTVNGKKISSNPTLSGTDILVGGSGTHNVDSVGASIESLYAKTINGVTIGGIINADEIPYSSDTDATSTYDKIESLGGTVSTINGSYVKTIKGSGTGVTVTPTTASKGDVTINVDASSLDNRIKALEGVTPVTTVVGDTGNTYVDISFAKNGNTVTATVDDSKIANVVSGYIHDIAVTDNSNYVSLTESENGGVSTLVLTDSIGDALKGKSNTGHGHAATEVSITSAINGSALNVQSALTKLHELTQSMAAGTQVVAVLGSLPSNTTEYKVGDIVVVGNKEYLCAPSAVGSSTNSWHLLGDVTQESQKITAIETLLATAPVLAGGTTNTNAIKVTAYGKTSNELVVPYAINAGTATNLSVAPALSADGNNIKVTAGGKTSAAFTVPYAATAGSASSATTAGTCTGNAATATKVGNSNIWVYPENSNEINFGGANNGKNIYIGYRGKDSREIPEKFIFGGDAGTASIKAATFIGDLTGNADSTSKVNVQITSAAEHYPLLFGSSAAAAAAMTTGLSSIYKNSVNTAYFIPSEGKLVAPQISANAFTGNLTGTASGNLAKTGGTITGTLQIKRNAPAIQYLQSNDTIWGWLGFGGENIPTVWESNGTKSYNIIHSGNYTSYQVDTKNTAGSSKDTGTLYLIGAKTQADSAQTYTSSTAVTVTNGNITASDFITTSDRRLKKNIVEVTDEMLEKSLGLNVYEFDYRNTDEHSVGYIAQEVQEVLPVMVKENKCSDGEEFLAVKYTPIHTMQIKALNNKVNQLTTENKALKERLEKLEKLVEKLM